MISMKFIKVSVLLLIFLVPFAVSADSADRKILMESFSDSGKIEHRSVKFERIDTQKLKRRMGTTFNGSMPFEQLLSCGDPNRCVDLVLLSEGYRLDEMPSYQLLVRKVIEKIFSVQPFKDYKSFFNVYRLDVSSNQSGLSQSSKKLRDTAFMTIPGCGRGTTSLCADIERIKEAASIVTEWDYSLVLINEQSAVYGTAYIGDRVALVAGKPKNLSDTVIHELGHLIGKLGDEYEYWGPNEHEQVESFYPNIAVINRKKWREWNKKKLGSDYDGPTGIYEGGDYSYRRVYRPSPNSRMRDSSRPFNAPSAEAIILSILQHTLPKDSRGFYSLNTDIPSGGVLPLDGSISTIPPSFPNLVTTYKWSLFNNNLTQALGNGTVVSLSSLGLTGLNNVLELELNFKHPLLITQNSRQALSMLNGYWYVLPRDIVPPPFDAIAGESRTAGGIVVSWSPTSNAPDGGVYIYRSANEPTCSSEELIASIQGTEFIDTSIASDTVYKYSVRAYSSRGLSDCVSAGEASLKSTKTKIIESPKSLTTFANRTVRFKVIADGTGLTYSWYENGNFIPGQDSDTLEVFVTPEKNRFKYTTLVTGRRGSELSKAASLKVLYSTSK